MLLLWFAKFAWSSPCLRFLGLHHGQGLAPITPAGEPDHARGGSRRGTPWQHVALLIQRELFAEKEVFRCKRSTGAQAEPEETLGITQ